MAAETYVIRSPLMGTFYRAASPGERPFVEQGGRVGASEVVCVIESMKVFTELRANRPGVVKRILVENEALVMKNQDLMEIEVS